MTKHDKEVSSDAPTVTMDSEADALAESDTVPGRKVNAPKRIGRFELRELLGKGGMGAVYRGFDLTLERDVAIKLLLTSDGDPTRRMRLLREAKAMAKLSHPNLVTVYEAGAHDEQFFIAMELVDGTTLRRWWEAEKPDREAILDAFVKAGTGLEAAHSEGIVHRDFKPENVLVSTAGDVQVADFGIATSPSSPEELRASSTITPELALTVTGAVIGTPRYMSPEQHLCEKVDARSDQFSFAVALAEAVNGESPYPGTTYEAIVKRVLYGEPVLPNRDTPLGQVLVRALARKPEDRFPSMAALLEALADARRVPVPSSRRLPIVAGLGFVVVVAAAVSVWAVGALGGGGKSADSATGARGPSTPAVSAAASPARDAGGAAPSSVVADAATPSAKASAPAKPTPVAPAGWKPVIRKGLPVRCHADAERQACAPCCAAAGYEMLAYPDCGCYRAPRARKTSTRKRASKPARTTRKPQPKATKKDSSGLPSAKDIGLEWTD